MSSSTDYPLEETLHFLFTTRSFSTGVPTQLAGTPVLAVYEADSITQITTGVSVSVDHDSLTGLNLATVVATAANGYATGNSYHIVITTGTVGGVSVVGEVVANFSVNHSSALRPSTRLRDLDVSSTGEAGIDWANVGSPTTSVNLSGTTINLVNTTTTNTDMRGTDSAALASVCTEARLSELDAATAGKAANQIDIIQTDTTTDIPALIAALNDIAATDIVSGGAITTSGGAVSNVTLVATTTTNTDMLTAAAVNTEVVDALNTDTYAEPGQEAPGTTVSLATKLGYLYKAWRNRSNQTATTYQLFNDDATTVDQKATVSDDTTTAEKGEIATGP